MLRRKVAERLARVPPAALFADGVVAAAQKADLFVLNLECAISDRGERWPDPFKPFFFRAPPIAVEVLRYLGVDCVTLANNHALDFGPVALMDTRRQLASAGIESVDAGVDERAPDTRSAAGHKECGACDSQSQTSHAAKLRRRRRGGVASGGPPGRASQKRWRADVASGGRSTAAAASARCAASGAHKAIAAAIHWTAPVASTNTLVATIPPANHGAARRR
jgi:hypothetical protein